ncbi:lipopolysaccharide 3-alpha-galactosyltransferase [Arsenophonus sp.]|uniref:lipopolysaccharide 3-alpha-galactosyltransferase n=1 Tax=Arsenophonus sp. TaxID=1872640 RepID=UPI00285EA442|nr:lipopolysaccharide 3-alpha-galactosyltransferase [Arsenophonus sp.]MDR5618257.1 lipopolysaccharide 3-alpha-galactosyltransferase [Arsenophonus sp.]
MYFDKHKVITQKLCLTPNLHADCHPKFHIAYGVDKNFLYGCGISITSIALHNINNNHCFHIFTDYFDHEQETLFDTLAQQYKIEINIYLVDDQSLKSLPSTKNWSYATYFRFIIADYFSNKLDKILYLDADIICNNSLDRLQNIHFNSNEIAAVVTEKDEKWWQKRASELEVENISQGYFNAGFLFINLNRWAEEDISTQAMRLLKNNALKNKFSFLDQDVLNILLANKIIYLAKKYNTQYSINYGLKSVKHAAFAIDTIFIHYIGPTKPWHEWAISPFSQPFIKAKNASPWQNKPLLKAESVHLLRYCAKHKFKQRKYHEGLKNYTHYYLAKFKILFKRVKGLCLS